MKDSTQRILMLAAFGALLLGAAPQKADSPEAMLRAAMDKESVDGDLKAAIEQYKKVIGRAGASRDVVAKALLRLGSCYERQGDAEAHKVYERVVREFSDQADAVREARGSLSATRVAATSGLTVRRVWTGPDVNDDGQISPDGRYLSFTRQGAEVAVRDLSMGENRVITHHLPGETLGVDDAFWSHDGKRLVYDWADYHEIRTINPDGTGMRMILRTTGDESISPYDWSADGKRILTGLAKKNDPQVRRFVWVNASDGAKQAITTTIRSSSGLFAYVSPDGRYIAFGACGTPKGPPEVHLIASDGSGETVLTAHPTGEYPVGWSPDGKYVLFVSMRANAPGLWAVPVADGKAQGAARVLQSYLGENVLPLGITRSGAFFYRNNTFTSDVYIASMDPSTGKVTSPAAPLPLARSGHNVAPRWSPDGRRMLVTWVQGPWNKPFREMYAISLDSGKEQPVSPRSEIPGAGWCWAEDGASVLANHERATVITRIKLGTGETSAAVEGQAGTVGPAFSCSANGKLLVYGDSVAKTIRLRDLENGSDKEVFKATENTYAWTPEISPDGSKVAFLVNTGVPGTALMVVSTASGSPRELMRVKYPWQLQRTKGLAWSPDSRYVYYLKRSDFNALHELFRISAAGGQEESIGLTAADIRDLAISPDGTRIAFSLGAMARPEIWALENFLPSGK